MSIVIFLVEFFGKLLWMLPCIMIVGDFEFQWHIVISRVNGDWRSRGETKSAGFTERTSERRSNQHTVHICKF